MCRGIAGVPIGTMTSQMHDSGQGGLQYQQVSDFSR